MQILFDFELRSPGIDPNALLNVSEKAKANIMCNLSVVERNECNGFFDEKIGFFIALMKQVNQKPKFLERVEQIIHFTDVRF